jgi:shikimate kinase
MNSYDDIMKNIEACDDKIIEVLNERLAYTEEITKYKAEHHMPILRHEEEVRQLKNLAGKYSNHPYKEEFEEIFRSISVSSRKIQAEVLFPKNIVLIGFMGAGKSSLASYLSENFYMRTVETDREIVQREGISIPEIFELYGEEYFREKETEVIRELGTGSRKVISVGGGAVMRDENVKHMKASGVIVLLTATPKAILDRVKGSTERPLLNGKMNEDYIAALMKKRRARYEDVADLIIDTTDKTIPEVCAEMILKLPAIVNQTKQTGLF